MHGRVWGRNSAVALAVAGVGLLVLAWIGTNPLSGAPDELDHELRALSIGRGELVGEKLPGVEPSPDTPVCCTPGNASARSWVRRGARFVMVPSRLDPLGLPCERVVAGDVKRCEMPRGATSTNREITTMGTIEAAAYVPSAVASRFAWSPYSALILTRLASASCALALIALGLAALRRGRRAPWVMTGALFAISPAVALVLSSPSPNAFEISGAFAFLGGMLNATRPGQLRRVDHAALWIGAVVLVLSRSLGPGWAIVLTLLAVALNGSAALRARVAANRVAAGAGVLVVATAASVTVLWEVLVQPHVPFDGSFFVDQIRPAFHQLDRVSHELVGVFGAVNVSMPDYVYNAWLLVLAAFVLAAIVLARSQREAFAILLVVAAVIAAIVGIAAALLRQNGFDVQGRHVLPLAMTLPVVAGVALDRRLGARWSMLAASLGVFLGVVHFAGWALNTATYARGPNGLFIEPVWGQEMFRLAFDRWGWALVALAGAALFATAPVVASRARS